MIIEAGVGFVDPSSLASLSQRRQWEDRVDRTAPTGRPTVSQNILLIVPTDDIDTRDTSKKHRRTNDIAKKF